MGEEAVIAQLECHTCALERKVWLGEKRHWPLDEKWTGKLMSEMNTQKQIVLCIAPSQFNCMYCDIKDVSICKAQSKKAFPYYFRTLKSSSDFKRKKSISKNLENLAYYL